MWKALRFDSSDVSGVIEDLGVLMGDFKAKITKAATEYLDAGEGGSADARAFSAFWVLREDAALKESGISPMDFAKEAEARLARFPNAVVNADEQRRLRAGLYRPLLALQKDERSRVVDGSSPRSLPSSR